MATPIIDDQGNFRGVVALDAPPGDDGSLNRQEVWDILAETAHGVWVVGRPVEKL